MKELIGKISAQLSFEDKNNQEGLIDLVNSNIQPPDKLTADMIHIRALYIASDQINSYGGRFPADDHDHLANLLIDSPVLVGHRKDSLPIARNFYAERVTHDGANWVKVYFYWLKSAEGGEDLRRNIDGGIYKEGSISFIFSLPECTICGKDIRNCRHQPFVKYKTPDGQKTASFNYRKIERVLETSLVYRGSVPNTHVEKNVFSIPENKIGESLRSDFKYPSRRRIWNIGQLSINSEYLIRPAYESIPIMIKIENQVAEVLSTSGESIISKSLDDYMAKLSWPKGTYVLDGRLIGYRGKERQKISELSKFLDGHKSKVTRIELKLNDILVHDDKSLIDAAGRFRMDILDQLFDNDDGLITRSIECTGSNLEKCISEISTRYGCEILELDSERRYLLTHRKLIQACAIPDHDSKTMAKLSVLIDGERIIVSFSQLSLKLKTESILEIEVNGIYRSGNNIRLMHPKVVDSSHADCMTDDLVLLAAPGDNHHTGSKYELLRHDQGVILRFDYDYDNDNEAIVLLVKNYSSNLLGKGRRFIAKKISIENLSGNQVVGNGKIESMNLVNSGYRLGLSGSLNGLFVLQPVSNNGQAGYLFSRKTSPASEASQ